MFKTAQFGVVRFFCFLTLVVFGAGEVRSQTYNLIDYRGSTAAGASWFYSGRDRDGLPADTRVQVASSNQVIICYAGLSSPVPYSLETVNPAELFAPMTFNLTVSKVDATHLTASIEGTDIPLVVSNQTAMLQSGPVTLPGSRVVHFQLSTDGAGVSLYMGSTELADNTDASAFIGLGNVVSFPSVRAALSLTEGGLVVGWNAVDGYVCDVLWASNLTNIFQSITAGIDYPLNSYTDTVHSVRACGYYKVDVRLK